MDELDEQPWYRQFWPWFIMSFPAASVIAGLATVYIAGAVPAMVVDDYGSIAMATEQRLEREQRAAELGLTARIEFAAGPEDGEHTVVVILAQADDAQPWPERLRVALVHPTLAERDDEAILEGSGGWYTGRIKRPAGRMYLSLTNEVGSWRMTGEMFGNTTRIDIGGEDRGL